MSLSNLILIFNLPPCCSWHCNERIVWYLLTDLSFVYNDRQLFAFDTWKKTEGLERSPNWYQGESCLAYISSLNLKSAHLLLTPHWKRSFPNMTFRLDDQRAWSKWCHSASWFLVLIQGPSFCINWKRVVQVKKRLWIVRLKRSLRCWSR